MIAFATLFLGLVAGIQDIQLVVGTEVASVQLFLDGAEVAHLRGEPWHQEVDLGAELEPHRLEAIAFDEGGVEVGRAEQWLNVPRPPAEASLMLDLQPSGQGSRAEVSWESLAAASPRSVELQFDGVPLPSDGGHRFDLPAYDPQQLHLLRAEIEFEENLTAVAEATFGGFFSEEVRTELTAIPVAVAHKPPDLAALAGHVRVDGQSARPVALEHSGPDVVVVRDQRSQMGLLRLGRSERPISGFGKDSRLRILWPKPQWRRQGDSVYMLFPRTSDAAVSSTEMYWVLSRSNWPRGTAEGQRLADAAAVAGLIALERNRPRAVVLILGPPGKDESQLAPAQVAHYLSTVGVPLFVWSTWAESWRRQQNGGWGEIVDISTLTRLSEAIREVRRALESQYVLWIDGIHLPQRVELDGAALGLERVR